MFVKCENKEREEEDDEEEENENKIRKREKCPKKYLCLTSWEKMQPISKGQNWQSRTDKHVVTNGNLAHIPTSNVLPNLLCSD